MKENIINDYVNNFISTTELSKKYNLNRVTIQRYLKSANIELRKKTPKTNVNHFYFSEYTENSCYWAGFILADGYIRTNKRFTLEITLQNQDVNHLYQFKKEINFDGRIILKELHSGIHISSSQIVGDLGKNFSIYNKKSLTCSIDENIPVEYLKDYIRGYFDGDGCITYTTTDTISFTGTEKTLDTIRKYFHDHVGIKLRRRSKEMPNITVVGNICVIFYSGKTAYKCLDHMYNKSTHYLDRKYNKYLALIEKYS